MKKCSSIAGFFNHSTNVKENLHKEQEKNNVPKKCLIQQVKTLRNSIYMMVTRILENLKVLAPILINEKSQKNNLIDDNEEKMLKEAAIVSEPSF